VVEGGGLENHCARKGTGGSNPSSSAKFQASPSLCGRNRARIDSSDKCPVDGVPGRFSRSFRRRIVFFLLTDLRYSSLRLDIQKEVFRADA
jgi:hypothetical protein